MGRDIHSHNSDVSQNAQYFWQYNFPFPSHSLPKGSYADSTTTPNSSTGSSLPLSLCHTPSSPIPCSSPRSASCERRPSANRPSLLSCLYFKKIRDCVTQINGVSIDLAASLHPSLLFFSAIGTCHKLRPIARCTEEGAHLWVSRGLPYLSATVS